MIRAAPLVLLAMVITGCRGGRSGPSRAEGGAGAAAPATARFVDVASRAGLHFKQTSGRSGRFYFPETMGSGCAFLDYDGDGRLDLFLNEGGRFRDVTAAAGPGMQGKIVGRGLAVGDFDSDGAPDLLVTENQGPARLRHNEGGDRHHWLAIRLRGVKSNREGLGTHVVLQAAGEKQIGWVRGGSSYCSDSEHVARFGLGPATQADLVELHWPSGLVQTLRNVKANQLLQVTEALP